MLTKDFYGVKCTTESIDVQHRSIMTWIMEPNSRKIITFLNPHVYNHCIKDPVVRAVLNRSDLISIDGVGIKLALLQKDREWYSRTIMTYLFERIIFETGLPKTRAVLIGTSETEVGRAAERINRISPCIEVAACYHGFQELDFYVTKIEKLPDVKIIMLGMGTPKSEHLIQKLGSLNRDLILWHIGGGTIKCYANTKRRSPIWLSKLGMEWLHRIVFEPHLIRRYLLGIPRFLLNIRKIKRQAKD
ncbi:MAG: WecB/TagA/CpsF family glycosyltransferase [Bacteroidales bacterium]|nr:WecB/TagA/CpsF family glycosyltransferase [Bacteroidales bacterium]